MMKHTRALKVKIKTLAAESRFIRREERASLESARVSAIRAQLAVAALSNAQTERIVRNALRKLGMRYMIDPSSSSSRLYGYESTPALDAALGDLPLERLTTHAEYHDLRRHRVDWLREEARASLLAYACLRGRRYEQVERPSMGNAPPLDAAERMAKRFGADPAEAAEWFARAREVVPRAG